MAAASLVVDAGFVEIEVDHHVAPLVVIQQSVVAAALAVDVVQVLAVYVVGEAAGAARGVSAGYWLTVDLGAFAAEVAADEGEVQESEVILWIEKMLAKLQVP